MRPTSAVVVLQRLWRVRASARHARAAAQLRAMAECVVCGDECAQLVRCAHGHACCVGCTLAASDTRCPLCREPRPATVDTSLAQALAACGTRLRCRACGVASDVADCEAHRAWCPAHRFVCPWSTCTHTVCAAEMAAHVRHHDRVHQLTRTREGCYHLVTALARPGDAVVTCAGDTTVVLTTARRMPHHLHVQEASPPMLHLHVRAYYASARAPALRATLRQLRVDGCDTRDAWSEEHRLGVVPPMIASRESVVLAGQTPALTPRALLAENFDHAQLVLPDVDPGAEASACIGPQVRAAGLRDVPALTKPLASPLLDGHAAPAVLLHVALCEDVRTPIGTLYDA